MNVALFGVYIRYRVKVTEIIKVNVLRLRFFVFFYMLFFDGLSDVVLIV